jgi:hypothetical protein
MGAKFKILHHGAGSDIAILASFEPVVAYKFDVREPAPAIKF